MWLACCIALMMHSEMHPITPFGPDMINELAYCENMTSLSWKLLLYHAALLLWPTARFAPDVFAEDSFRDILNTRFILYNSSGF